MINKIIPTLKGKEAKRFIKMADSNLVVRGSIDFTKQSYIMKGILAKSKINKK